MTELTTKIYNIKTSGFEHSNELSGVRSKIKGLENNLDAILKQFSKLREEENVQNTDLTSVKSDLTNVKTSMTSLSASLLNLKSQVASNYEMDQKVSSKLWIHFYKYLIGITIRIRISCIPSKMGLKSRPCENSLADLCTSALLKA